LFLRHPEIPMVGKLKAEMGESEKGEIYPKPV